MILSVFRISHEKMLQFSELWQWKNAFKSSLIKVIDFTNSKHDQQQKMRKKIFEQISIMLNLRFELINNFDAHE